MVGSSVEGVLFDESINEAIRTSLPGAVVSALEVITHLGDGVTLIVFATLLYWFGAEERRRSRALVIAIGIGALAISAGLKGIFLRPRPELAFAPAGYPGYSFPSAHALGAAAFYGALAAVADTGTRRTRYVVAGAVIALVALSRVVMGVHYVGDVVVGVALGLLFVAAILRFGRVDPGFVFALAGLIAILGFALGSREFTTMTVGASLGATVAWLGIGDRPADPRGASILLLGWLCLPLLIALRAAPAFWTAHWSLELLGFAVATAAVLVVPVAAERMNGWPPVEWLQTRLPFTGRVVDRERLKPPFDD